jgi:hypothetical protein
MKVVVTALVGLGLLWSGIAAASARVRTQDTSLAAVPLGARPASVTRFCVERARRDKFTVLCPTRYPRTSRSAVMPSGSSVLGPSFYWASFNDAAGFHSGDNGHVTIGGQREPLSLAGQPGQTWPRPGQPEPVKQLNLPRLIKTPKQDGRQYVAQRPARIVRHATIEGRGALVLSAAPYPIGGFMGGHVIVLWNSDQHGYVLSLHLEAAPNGRAYSLADRVTAALRVAGSFSPVTR